MTPGSWHR